MDQDSSTRNQSANQQTTDRQSSEESSRFRLVWIVYLFNTAYLLYYCFNKRDHVEYHRHENNDCLKLVNRCPETAQNKTPSECYRKVETTTFPILINVLLGLLGTIISPFVHCLCDFFQKLVQSKKCRGSWQLLKSCFSGGILWGGVFLVGLLIIIGLIAYFLATGIPFNDGHQLFILSGCSISNLVTWLLGLDKQTPKEKQTQPSSDHEDNASSNHEKNYLHPAYTLAWDYYFNHLKNVLTIFNRDFIDTNTPVRDVGLGPGTVQDAQPKMWVDLKKMIILISPNCIAEHDLPLRNLHDLDNKIDFIREVCRGGNSFSVYRLKYNGKQWTCVIEYVQKSLETLKKMCCAEYIKNLHDDQFKAQVELFFSTLVSEILSRNSMSASSCIPILTMAEPGSLEDGGLVKIIMEKVEPNCTITMGKNRAHVGADTNSQAIISHVMHIPEDALVEQPSNSDEKTELLPSHQQIKKRRRPVDTHSREVHDGRQDTNNNPLTVKPTGDANNTTNRNDNAKRRATNDYPPVTEHTKVDEQLSSHHLMYNNYSDNITSRKNHDKRPATNDINPPVTEHTGNGEKLYQSHRLRNNSDYITSGNDHAKRPATNDKPPVTEHTGNGEKLSQSHHLMNNSDHITSGNDHPKRQTTNDNRPATYPTCTGDDEKLSSRQLMNNTPSRKVHNTPAIPLVLVSDSTDDSAQKSLTEDQDVLSEC